MARGQVFQEIGVGDTVEYSAYAGWGQRGPEFKPATGRAVMKGPEGWVLNIGGKHGRTAVVNEENFLGIKRKARK